MRGRLRRFRVRTSSLHAEALEQQLGLQRQRRGVALMHHLPGPPEYRRGRRRRARAIEIFARPAGSTGLALETDHDLFEMLHHDRREGLPMIERMKVVLPIPLRAEPMRETRLVDQGAGRARQRRSGGSNRTDPRLKRVATVRPRLRITIARYLLAAVCEIRSARAFAFTLAAAVAGGAAPTPSFYRRWLARERPSTKTIEQPAARSSASRAGRACSTCRRAPAAGLRG